MEIKEKVELVKLLSELNGVITINKVSGKYDENNLSKAKTVAQKLSDEGIGNFDFSSDEKFAGTLADFLAEF